MVNLPRYSNIYHSDSTIGFEKMYEFFSRLWSCYINMPRYGIWGNNMQQNAKEIYYSDARGLQIKVETWGYKIYWNILETLIGTRC